MRPGDEVECIKDLTPAWHRNNARSWHITPPVVGQRYTVRDLCPVAAAHQRVWLLLAELRSPRVRFRPGEYGEASFPAANFRLITKSTATTEQWLAKPADADSEQWDNRRSKITAMLTGANDVAP